MWKMVFENNYKSSLVIKEKLPIEKRLKIGFPKALVFYEHCKLWKDFFDALGCDVITSDDTNRHILDIGVKMCSNEICLPVKIFHGHAYSLKDKVDYVFIPRYDSYIKNEFTCPKFCGLPDMTYLNLKKEVKIIEIRVNVTRDADKTKQSLMEFCRVLNKDYDEVYDAFENTVRKRLKEESFSHSDERFDDNKPLIAVLGHPYMLRDEFINMNLINKLKDKGVSVITPADIDGETKRRNAAPFDGRTFWSVGFDNLGCAFTVITNPLLKGIIYLTPFACGIDSIVTELIEKKLRFYPNVNWLRLSIDEHTGEAGFDTRVEAFLDMIGGIS